MSRFNSYDNSVTGAAATAAGEIVLDMTPGRQYQLRARGADIWFRVVKTGGAGAAVAGAGSHFLPQGQAVPVATLGDRNRISVIRDASTDGTAILSETPGTTGSS